MTPLVLYLAAVVLWIAGVIAWGIFFAWETKDLCALALFGAVFLPFVAFFLVCYGVGNAAFVGIDRLNGAVQRRRRVRADIEAEVERIIAEVLRS